MSAIRDYTAEADGFSVVSEAAGFPVKLKCAHCTSDELFIAVEVDPGIWALDCWECNRSTHLETARIAAALRAVPAPHSPPPNRASIDAS